jgi:hypothetical protein
MSQNETQPSRFQIQRKALRKRLRVDILPILQVVGLWSGIWLVAVIAVASLGWVEILCWTPAGWLLAIPAARMVLRRTPSRDGAMRLREAVAAGGTIGVVQALVFAVGMSATAQGGLDATAVAVKVLFGVGMFLVVGFAGAVAGAMLAFAGASYWQRSLRW